MPTYEFRCPEGHEFEKFYRTISGAESAAACPQCGKIAERMMSAAGFAFKGSGFYLTDYGKNAHRGSPDGKPGATSAPETSSDSPKPESSKPDATAAPKASDATSSSTGDSKKTEPKASDAKPSAPAPKPSSGE